MADALLGPAWANARAGGGMDRTGPARLRLLAERTAHQQNGGYHDDCIRTY